MDKEPYLVRLGTRLRNGLQWLAPKQRERHRAFIYSQQQPDGGFSGREGGSDLYYTSFAVRSLAMLDVIRPDDASLIANYLSCFTWEQLDALDLINWLSCALTVQAAATIDVLANAPADWQDQISANLEKTRQSDGGYARTRDGKSGSTYHSFLVALTYELIGRSVPNSEALTRFVLSRQREDGGFVEIAPMKRGGTNPTAAAAALLQMFDAMRPDSLEGIRRFLETVVGREGGFRANTRVPFADGLSTFTGLLTCRDLVFRDLINPQRLREFVGTSLDVPTGGFRAAPWDKSVDVEYSFYGLGALALV